MAKEQARSILPIPNPSFTHGLGFQRVDANPWFDVGRSRQEVLSARRHTLMTYPASDSIILAADARPMLEEFFEKVGWGGMLPATEAGLAAFAREYEPDVLFYDRPYGREPTLLGGALVTPTKWHLGEKIGQRISAIHEPVPTLNQIERKIRLFLERKPHENDVFVRHNMGLTDGKQWDMNPLHGFDSITAESDLSQLYIRWEETAIHILPRTGGGLFLIRYEMHPLGALTEAVETRREFAGWLDAMDPAVREYKGIAPIYQRLRASLN